ncbi:unnamed protein product [Adineta steineri]|uniref:NHL repeat containing protein n=1 Tax=Adineta steineri TaxID=433720 RepID=A0A818QTI2_9BILA|nr:unnamed protein product [Adineta steineri]
MSIHVLLRFRADVDVLHGSEGQLILSPSASWATYANTVAGSSTCASGSTSSLLNTNLGIQIVNNNTLYIADQNNHRIVVIQPNSTTAAAIIGSGPGSGPTQLNYPKDVFVTSQGIYVLDSSNYRILKFWTNGTNATIVVGITGTAGGALSNTTIGMSYQMFVDSSSNIYVLDYTNHKVLLFPPNSTSGTTGMMIAGTGSAGSAPNMLYNPRGMFVDSASAMYIADTYNNRIQYWVNGACYGSTVAGTGTLGSSLSQLYYPVAVIVDVNQYMYITDQFNNRILRWLVGSCVGQCIAACASTAAGQGANQVYYSVRVVFDGVGSLYVSDSANNRVQQFMILNNSTQTTGITQIVTSPITSTPSIISTTLSPQSQLVLSPSASWLLNATTVAGSSAGTSGSTSSLLNTNLGIQIVNNNTLYIADQNNHRIVVIQPNSTTAAAIIGSGPGSGPTQLNYPKDVFVTSQGIYVLDSSNYRILKFWTNGTNATIVVGITGTAGGALSNTTIGMSYQMFVDSSSNIYVLDYTNHKVLLFPPNSTSGTTGMMIAGTGSAGSAPNMLYNPRGMFVDSASAMYIADTYNNRIQYWVNGACYGSTVAGTGTLGSSLSQLYYPVAVIVDVNQYMYITDQFNNRILRWLVGSCVGQCIAACASTAAGQGANQVYYSVRVVFDGAGSLYVSDSANSRVQQFMIATSSSK